MQNWKKRTTAIVVSMIFMTIALNTPALAQDPYGEISGESMAFDLVVLRPLGIAVTTLGCAFFVASLPFTIWSKKRFTQAGNCFVVEPAEYTFVRPLGKPQEASDKR